jgi:hypothetical protein
LRLRLSNDQSDQSYSRPLTSTLALTFRWDARSGSSISPHPWRDDEQAWKDHWTCAVGGQTRPPPEKRRERAWRGHSSCHHNCRVHTTEVLSMRRFRRCP